MDDPTRDGVPEMSGVEAGRRRLLKALTVSAGAAAAAAIAPKSWVKPLVDAVDVPLHAQGTATLTISNLQIGVPAAVAMPAFVPLENLSASFVYLDAMGLVDPTSTTEVYAYFRNCGASSIPLVDGLPLAVAGAVVGNKSSGTFTFSPFTVPSLCGVSPTAALAVQISAEGPGGTLRLSNWLEKLLEPPRDS